ncbi:Eukaryotic translation initiation factor 2 subunit 3 [Mortierella hygrophila]|uniref:Histone-lysine N-methyltransferase n=1 Tax=Mortierella hygrophila TaxID=979708 RepID=A0A9P6FA16_9FUNG|nr:Eukaryotic translation initiation factor 2 subunit 3 [Mortierella hygrophila]
MARKGSKKIKKPIPEVEATYEVKSLIVLIYLPNTSGLSPGAHIESIWGYRNIEGKQEFLVKWLGYPVSDNTWEPLENLDNCPFIVNEFLVSYGICELRGRAEASVRPQDLRPTVQDTFSSASILATQQAAATRSALLFRPQSKSPAHRSSRSISRSRRARNTSHSPSRLESVESKYQTRVRDRELRAFEILFKDSKGPEIIVENTVDSAGRPKHFKYINDSVYGMGVPQPDPDFILSCSCAPGECGLNDNCSCMKEAKIFNDSGAFPFESDGKVAAQANKLLWECNSKCGCGPSCTWNYSQRPRQLALKIKRFEGKGWGLVLDQRESVPPRTFVSRYVGEIITNKEAEHRSQMQDSTGTTYLFDLDYNAEKQATYSIDACKLGNETHFINHSCDPNLSVYMLKSGGNGGDENLMTLSFWSNRWIKYGDELTFDYNGKYVPEWHKEFIGEASQSQGTLHPGEGTTPCHCSSTNCRKWVHL